MRRLIDDELTHQVIDGRGRDPAEQSRRPRGPDILFTAERLADLIVILDDVTARASAS
ncbi:MAG: hypothetical protein ACRDQZ_26980 [Mycobacteriales bacterium]